MELAALVGLVLVERARFDLPLRRWWAARGWTRPGPAVRVPVPVALAGTEVRRWVLRLSTLLLLGWSWFLLTADGAERASDGVNFLVGYYLAFIGLAVLAIVAATAGRDRGNELLDACPAGPRSRVLGTAGLVALLALAEYLLLLCSRYLRGDLPYESALPGPWELTHGPLVLLGGGILGLLLARLVPGWVAAPIGVVATVAWTVLLDADPLDDRFTMLTPVVEWARYLEDDLVSIAFVPGSLAWNNAFLMGLAGLGVVAALLREPGRRRALVGAGALLAAGTVTAALLALP